ncbi:MAG TPA: methyl-accepting chemotaxis protein [Symbiobacteriaceae bacterium]|nr:methyl-accepting chemotaxis protein [Symbiobacteriaceae bacterium]
MRLHPKRWSLATKWSLMLTALALGPLLAVISYSFQSASAKLLAQTVTSLQQGAADGAASLDDALAERVRQARFLAALPSVRDFALAPAGNRGALRAAVTSDLRGLQPAYSYLQSLDILDAEGFILYSTAGHAGFEQDQPLAIATDAGQVYVGGLQKQAGRTEAALVIAVPVGNQVVLRTETSSQFLMQRVGRQNVIRSLLVDTEGRIIAASRGVAAGGTAALDNSGRVILPGGEVLYAQAATLGTLPWRFVAGVPEAQLVRDMNEQKVRVIMLALGASAIIGVVARLLGLSFTRPLADMAAATQALAAGDLTYEVKPTARMDEVGRLQNAFAEAYQQLRRLAARMRLSSILVAEAAGHMHAMAGETEHGRYPMTTASEKLSMVAQDLDRQVAHFKV